MKDIKTLSSEEEVKKEPKKRRKYNKGFQRTFKKPSWLSYHRFFKF